MAKTSTPPDVPASLDLDGWLDAQEWVIPVPAPLDVRKSLLMGSKDYDGWRRFSPSQHPWLATEFAHVAASLKTRDESESPPLGALDDAVRFANQYGLVGPWPSYEGLEGPPLEMPIEAFLRDAWDLRQVLLDYQELPVQRQIAAILETRQDPFVRFLGDAEHLLRFSVRPDLVGDQVRPQVRLEFGDPLPLVDVMRLQLLADFLANRPVATCQRRDCGKLFIWSRGRRSGAPSRSAGLRGPTPQFCSYSHAQAELRDRRRQREGD